MSADPGGGLGLDRVDLAAEGSHHPDLVDQVDQYGASTRLRPPGRGREVVVGLAEDRAALKGNQPPEAPGLNDPEGCVNQGAVGPVVSDHGLHTGAGDQVHKCLSLRKVVCDRLFDQQGRARGGAYPGLLEMERVRRGKNHAVWTDRLKAGPDIWKDRHAQGLGEMSGVDRLRLDDGSELRPGVRVHQVDMLHAHQPRADDNQPSHGHRAPLDAGFLMATHRQQDGKTRSEAPTRQPSPVTAH